MELLTKARDWVRSGHQVALATVVRTWGSAPTPTGSQMIVRDDGLFEGSVSGGCIEGAVITVGLKSIATGLSEICRYGVSDETAFSAGLACGGEISVLVEPLACGERGGVPLEMLEAIMTAVAARQPISYCLALMDQTRQLLPLSGQPLSAVEARETHVIIHHLPKPRLYLIGAVHIAQHLLPIAASCGFALHVIDPRSGFAHHERFAQIAAPFTLLDDWPDLVLRPEDIDAYSALVTLTHEPRIDDAALRLALKSKAFYIGALGSRRTHAARVARLLEEGFAEVDIARIHGPVGLAIGARTPAEIAVSIMGELIEKADQAHG